MSFIKAKKLFLCGRNSKIPAKTGRGYHDAKIDPNILEKAVQSYNIGYPMRPNKNLAIDMDNDYTKGLNGIKTIKDLEKELGQLPQTITQITPRGGLHYIFSDEGITNPIGKIGKDVDIKWNGYILVAPSSINGKFYEIVSNGVIEPAKLPQAWLYYLNKSNSKDSCKKSYKNKPKNILNVGLEPIYKSCKFAQHCINNAEILSEPEWWAFGALLGYLENGEELFQEFSSPHPNYSYEETQAKFENAKKYSITCNTISGISECCDRCEHNKGEKDD